MATETQAQDRAELRVVQGNESGPQEALALLENAHRVAEDAINSAKAEAERVMMAARHEATELRKQAREHSEREVAEAGRKAETARAQAQEEASRMVADARGEVAELEQAKERLINERDSVAQSAQELAQRLFDSVSASRSHEHNDGQ